MKISYRPAGSDEQLKELGECTITPIWPDEEAGQEHQSEPFPRMEPITLEFTVEGIAKKFPKSRYPRKLKKAIGQMWEARQAGNEVCIIFSPKHRTRWQRKALKKIRIKDNFIEYPTKNGKALLITLISN